MGCDLQKSSFRNECHMVLADNLACVVLAGDYRLAFEDEDHEVVVEVGFQDGFSFFKGNVGYSCDVIIVVVDEFRAVLVGYEAVILHETLNAVRFL